MAIDTAITALNAAWQAASQEMYQATQQQASAGTGNTTGSTSDNNVSDVEYEEVNDKK